MNLNLHPVRCGLVRLVPVYAGHWTALTGPTLLNVAWPSDRPAALRGGLDAP